MSTADHPHDDEVLVYGECITCGLRSLNDPAPVAATEFDGADVTAADNERLRGQLGRVRDAMLDGEWRTLAELATLCGAPEASVSARLRDLRKPRHGGYVVERRNEGGLYAYRIARSAQAVDKAGDTPPVASTP